MHGRPRWALSSAKTAGSASQVSIASNTGASNSLSGTASGETARAHRCRRMRRAKMASRRMVTAWNIEERRMRATARWTDDVNPG